MFFCFSFLQAKNVTISKAVFALNGTYCVTKPGTGVNGIPRAPEPRYFELGMRHTIDSCERVARERHYPFYEFWHDVDGRCRGPCSLKLCALESCTLKHQR